MKINLFILLFASLIGCEQCEDDLTELEKLPPATQEGKNTFGCLVNGKAWVTKTSIAAAAFYQGGLLHIGANMASPDETIRLSLGEKKSSIEQGKVYSLNDPFIATAEFYRGLDYMQCDYSFEYTYSGTISITKLDKFEYIFSGEF
ncbi:MAG: hypothetical protein ACOYXT_09315, partial [Bacteroidota bacterium]